MCSLSKQHPTAAHRRQRSMSYPFRHRAAPFIIMEKASGKTTKMYANVIFLNHFIKNYHGI